MANRTVKTLRLEPLVDLSPYIKEGAKPVAINVGPRGEVYVALALDRGSAAGTAGFVRKRSEVEDSYRVLAFLGREKTLDVMIRAECFDIHHVQPLPQNRLLLVCCRCFRGKGGGYEPNARIYTCQGHFVGSILLGDGIEDVQVTASGTIWTSYFDEGIFGGVREPAIGASGLVAWTSSGEKLYEYQPVPGLEPIDDCYVMNVASESDVWIYYYAQFPLVHLRCGEVLRWWHPRLHGAEALAVKDDLVLFQGSYRRPNRFYLSRLSPDGTIRRLGRFTISDREGIAIRPDRIVGRGSTLYFEHGNGIYRLDVDTAADA